VLDEAYGRFSNALDLVLQLPASPTDHQIEGVLKKLTDASDSKWFKEVSQICNRLEVIANAVAPELQLQIKYADQRQQSSGLA
jgi:hypothetical protein